MIREPLSYWQETAVPTPLSSDLPSSVDVAIVGRGILGALPQIDIGGEIQEALPL